MRVGHGYDVHRLVTGRDLVLGGVKIEHDKGLLGHSDADVVLHALCDAILGAVGAGDIGQHFADSDPSYSGIDSRKLLCEVTDLMFNKRRKVANVDITIVAQNPKLAPHLDAMRDNIAADLQCKTNRVNLKATTTEKLGMIGREEGIACHAVVLLKKLK